MKCFLLSRRSLLKGTPAFYELKLLLFSRSKEDCISPPLEDLVPACPDVSGTCREDLGGGFIHHFCHSEGTK